MARCIIVRPFVIKYNLDTNSETVQKYPPIPCQSPQPPNSCPHIMPHSACSMFVPQTATPLPNPPSEANCLQTHRLPRARPYQGKNALIACPSCQKAIPPLPLTTAPTSELRIAPHHQVPSSHPQKRPPHFFRSMTSISTPDTRMISFTQAESTLSTSATPL